MGKVFVISDTHFGHKNILNFRKKDGELLRDFRDLNAMNDYIIEKWCSVVTEADKVYHLGDFTMSPVGFEIMASLPGKKRLVAGNHDHYPTERYLTVFERVCGVRQINGVWLTHVPMWEGSVNEERVKLNVHGHLHAGQVRHPKYFNASVERIDYTPIDIAKLGAPGW